MKTEGMERSGWTSRTGLLACVVGVFVAAILGSMASIQAPAFYAELIQPAWAPPASWFGPVWTVLYIAMAMAAVRVWKKGGDCAVKGLKVFMVQLVLNALWSWIFFAWRQGLGSFLEIVALWVAILWTLRLFLRVDRWAGWLLLPYLAWVSFAMALNWALWRGNLDLLS